MIQGSAIDYGDGGRYVVAVNKGKGTEPEEELQPVLVSLSAPWGDDLETYPFSMEQIEWRAAYGAPEDAAVAIAAGHIPPYPKA